MESIGVEIDHLRAMHRGLISTLTQSAIILNKTIRGGYYENGH